MKQESCGIWSYCSYSHDAVTLIKVKVSPFSLIDQGREGDGGAEQETGRDAYRPRWRQAKREAGREIQATEVSVRCL